MTTEQFYHEFLKRLQSIYEEREADNISDWVFEKVIGLKKMDRRIKKNTELKSGYILQLEKYLEELLQHKPVQYVLNEAWFYKMKFFVNQHVLIPRPETEELVSWIIEDVALQNKNANLKLLDIGTGSGSIAIAIKKNLHNIEITALDVSDNALEAGKINADLLSAEINFLQSDFINELSWDILDRYDIIVSNPPYIPASEKGKLFKNITEFEPHLALFVNDNNPFIFYKKIAKFAQTHLITGGKVYVEIHEDYAKEVQDIFSNESFKTKIRKDIYGKERMIKANR